MTGKVEVVAVGEVEAVEVVAAVPVAVAATAPAKAVKAVKAKKEAKPKAPKIERIVQNGVTRPADGTKTGLVWLICEQLSDLPAGKVVARADLMKEGEVHRLDPSTISTQFSRWRRFNGIKGRVERKAIQEAKVVENDNTPKT